MKERVTNGVLTALDDLYLSFPVGRALMQLLPGGSSIDVFVSTQLAEMSQRRQDAFFERLRSGSIGLTPEVVRSEMFLRRFVITLAATQRDLQESKVLLFANLLTNGCADQTFADDDYTLMLRIVEDLSAREFAMLRIIESYENEARADHPDGLTLVQFTNLYWSTLRDDLAAQLNVERNEIYAFLARVQRTGLYAEITGTYMNYVGGQGTLTALWPRFIRYVAGPDEYVSHSDLAEHDSDGERT